MQEGGEGVIFDQIYPFKEKFMKPKYLAIIILAAVAIGASAVYYAQQPAKDLNPIVIKHNNPNSPAPIIAQNEFRDWKTYTNSEYGFEFKYPNNWDVASQEIIVGQTNYLNNYEIIHSTNGFGNFPSGIDFSLENNLAKLPIADWVSKNIDNTNVIKINKISVAEKPAIELTTTDRSAVNNTTYTEIYIPIMDKVLWFSVNNDLKEVKGNLKSIISTFKY
jgi:hypothetical protein